MFGRIWMPKISVHKAIGRLAAALTFGTLFAGCESRLEVRKTTSGLSANVVKIKPLVAKPNELVTITGTKFATSGQDYGLYLTLTDGTRKAVPISVKSASEASFVMPEGLGLGLKSADIYNGKTKLGSFDFVADQASNSLPIIIDEEGEICTTRTYIDKNGATKTGSKVCSGGSVSECQSGGEVGCKTSATFVAGLKSNLTSGNIASGVSLGGVTGQYPSSSFPLVDSSLGVDDLTSSSLESKVTQLAQFEFWDSSGTRHLLTGDNQISSGNIKDTVDVFGVVGTNTGSLPDPWDLRAGVTVGAVTGRLKVNCRNVGRSAAYDYDGAVGSIPNTSVNTGTTLDTWDTIDDYNGNSTDPMSAPAIWASGAKEHECTGIEATAGDYNVWKDTTTTGCQANDECIMQDKISKLEWTGLGPTRSATSTSGSPTATVSSANGLRIGMPIKMDSNSFPDNTYITNIVGTTLTLSQNATSSTTSGLRVPVSTWNAAVSYCDGLTWDGKADWRLPTQKELLDAFVHGIYFTASINWMDRGHFDPLNFWSSTTSSILTSDAFFVDLDVGLSYGNDKNSIKNAVLCVRP